MDQTGTIQALGIRIANDAITIATLEADNNALRAEIERLTAAAAEDPQD